MRHLAILACLLSALAPGCLDAGDGATPQAGDAPADPRAAPGTRTATMDLGTAKGSSLTGAAYGFTVTVPAGGAAGVHWTLTVEGPAVNGVTHRVEGPGCGSDGALVVLGTSATTFGGSCDDLPAGEHAFTAVVGSGTLAFTATVEGRVAEATA